MRSWGRWVSEIRIPRSRRKIWLGSYSTPEQAARAFDAASLLLRRPSSSLNFPLSPPPVSATGCLSSPRTIQATASAVANSSLHTQLHNPEITVEPASHHEVNNHLPPPDSSPPHFSSHCAELDTPEPTLQQEVDPLRPEVVASHQLTPTINLNFDSPAHADLLISCPSPWQHNCISDASVVQALLINDQNLIEDFQTSLASYGFTATSGAITISERIDIDHFGESTDSPLWNL